jgi:hypothetical protein
MKRLTPILEWLIVAALYAVLAWMLRDWYFERYCSIGAQGTWECGK